MPLDYASKAASLARTDHIYAVPGSEHVNRQTLSFFNISFLDTKFAQVLHSRQIALDKMSTRTTRELLGGNLFKPQLRCGSAFSLSCTHCGHKPAPSLLD